jgi:hypothetical protein
VTLSDLRKLSVKKTLRIRFVLPNGMECTVDEHGLAQIPALNKVPDFNLDHELPAVGEFLLEFRAELDKKGMPRRQTLTRADLDGMTKASAGGAAAAADHDDD